MIPLNTFEQVGPRAYLFQILGKALPLSGDHNCHLLQMFIQRRSLGRQLPCTLLTMLDARKHQYGSWHGLLGTRPFRG